MVKKFSKKKDRKSLRRNRWQKKNCCPECGIVYDKDYLAKWKLCIDCYMYSVGMSWGDFR